MTACVKIKLGNLFDGPADVIVLPCSTAGTVTGVVARALNSYSIHIQILNMGTWRSRNSTL